MKTLAELRTATAKANLQGECRRCKANNPRGSGAHVQLSLQERTKDHTRIANKGVALCESCAVEAYERFLAFIAEAPA